MGRLSRSGELPRAAVAAAAAAAALLLLSAPAEAGTAVRTRVQPFAVGLRILRLVDRSRSIRLPDGRTVSRTLVTYVRYPALARPGGRVLGAPPARGAGPFPLVVFGHGYAVTPALYDALLRAWTEAGYVVAAPVFPLENANAPGGPNERDLGNEPGDIRFVIARLLASSAAGRTPLRGLIDPARIAVAGHSDGAEAALLAAYDPAHHDPRIRAAVLLSGAQTPRGGIGFLAPSAPLLAVQGTADTINPPSITDAFFRIAPRPKFLLRLLAAGHLPPYADEQPQLSVVERVTVAFLDRYLKHGSLGRLRRSGSVPGVAELVARP